ncbi:hypothetical protein EON82_03505 [bacterium]|nr:MAG: hypothetical protein EON82_03505 [bacterium]
MKRTTILLGSALAAVALAGGVSSGLNKGEDVTPFHPSHFAGPLANTTNCFPCTFQNRPQVQVWVNGDSLPNVAKIAKSLSAAMKENQKAEFKALVVFVAEGAQAESIKNYGVALSKRDGFSGIAMATISPKDASIKNYKINLSPEVKNTVLVYRNWKVQDKLVNLTSDEKGLKTLEASIQSVVK